MTPSQKERQEYEKYFFSKFSRHFLGAFTKFMAEYIGKREEALEDIIEEVEKRHSKEQKAKEGLDKAVEKELEDEEDKIDQHLREEIQDNEEEEPEDDLPPISEEDIEKVDPRELVESLLKKVLKDTNLKVETIGKKRRKIVIEI
jgi:hypothetical protein